MPLPSGPAFMETTLLLILVMEWYWRNQQNSYWYRCNFARHQAETVMWVDYNVNRQQITPIQPQNLDFKNCTVKSFVKLHVATGAGASSQCTYPSLYNPWVSESVSIRICSPQNNIGCLSSCNHHGSQRQAAFKGEVFLTVLNEQNQTKCKRFETEL